MNINNREIANYEYGVVNDGSSSSDDEDNNHNNGINNQEDNVTSHFILHSSVPSSNMALEADVEGLTGANSDTHSTPVGEKKYDGVDDLDHQDKQDKQQQNKKQHIFFYVPLPIKSTDTLRYISLGWGILVMLISGTLYGFAVISNDIKHKLDFDQTQINEAISIGDVGIYLGVTVGYIYDIYGPFYTCLIASAFYILGYFGCWAVVNGNILANPLLLSLFLFFVGQGSHASFTASIVSNVHNFPLKHRGKVSGGLVGCFAISSGIFGAIYKGTFKKTHNVEGYLIFLAITLSAISLVGSILVRKIGSKKKEVENNNQQEEKHQQVSIQDQQNYELMNRKDSSPVASEISALPLTVSSDVPPLRVSSITQLNELSISTKIKRIGPNYLDGKRDISGFQLLKTLEFWLMIFIYYFAAGASLMLLNNIGSIAAALKKPETIQSDLVLVFAFSNLSGRFLFGLSSDLLSKKISRFWFLVFSSSIISITHALFAYYPNNLFVFATILTGIGYGGMVSMIVTLASLRFGVRRFGLNFGLLAIASAAGSLTFGYVSGATYDHEVKEQNNQQHQCFGPECFETAFTITFICNLASVLVGLILIYHNRQNRIKYIQSLDM